MSLGRAPWGLGVVQRSGAPGTGAVAAFVSRELDRFWPLPASCAGAGGRFLQPVLEAWAREGAPPEYSQAQGPGEALGGGSARLLAPLVRSLPLQVSPLSPPVAFPRRRRGCSALPAALSPREPQRLTPGRGPAPDPAAQHHVRGEELPRARG